MTTPAERERAEFEAWAISSDDGKPIYVLERSKLAPQKYADPFTNSAWRGWQAARREERKRRESESLADRFRRLSGNDLSSNPPEDSEFIQDANEIYNDGFEAAHVLRQCGHPVACYQCRNYPASHDNYDPETDTSDPSLDYRCITCEAIGEERKRCAELCESEAAEYDKSSRHLDAAGYTVGGGHDAAGSVASKSIAAKIRALSALEE